MNLEILNKKISDCTQCSLRETATQPVCGNGEVGVKYMVIGEAPGREEDAAGVPFIGKAGKRLDKLLALAGIDINDCYITNVIRCRPPKNRDPRKGEIKACVKWLDEEIRLVKPQYIIALGAIPTGLFSKYGISQLHGTMIDFEWNGEKTPIIFQYHPAAALHQPRLWAQMLTDWEWLPEKVDHNYIVVTSGNILPKEYRKGQLGGYQHLIALDTENAPDGSLGQWSIAFRDEADQICVSAFYGREGASALQIPTSKITLVGMHHAKWDLRVLKANKMHLPKNVVCTMIMAYCLGLGKQDVKADAAYTNTGMVGGLGLKYLARRHLGMEMKTWQDVKDHPEAIPEYNADDSVSTLLLAEKWLPKLPEHFWKIDMPLLGVLMAIEDRGIAIDPAFLDTFVQELDTALAEIDLPINPYSPKQLIKYFYEERGYQPTKFTETGQPSTEKEILETFNDPVADKIISYKGLHQDRTTYMETYVKKVDSGGRIHAEFKQTSTATGRLSCAKPNLQNVPKRDEARAEMRKLFVATPGCLLVRADYSQLELRVFAALAGEERMKEVFARGGNIHQETADVLGLSYYDAKTVNFLMLYGGGAWKISQEFHVPIDQAKLYLQRYFQRFPGILDYFKQILEVVNESKEIANYFGRTRRLDALYAEDWRVRKQGEREAINTPIQGTAAEIVKLAMIRLHYEHQAPMILAVHDELLFEVEKKTAIDYAHWLKTYIPTLVEINGMCFPVEVSVGENWYDQTEV